MPDAVHNGKVAIVTGAASGIGQAIATRLVDDGATVVLADIDEDGLRTTRKRLGSTAQARRLDVTDCEAVTDLVETTAGELGRLDIMVNNAGLIDIGAVSDTDPDRWRHLFDVNVHGTFYGCRAAARIMRAQNSGCIVNASSGAGRRGVPNLAGYCASKAAIIMLSQSLAVELAPHNVRVNCYTPGHIETPFWKQIAAGFAQATEQTEDAVIESFRQSVPMGRFGRPEEVAATVSWLASDEAAYISGQAIAMNGAEFPY